MSTKATIFHNNKLHFYEEVFDNENIYLELYDLEEASIQIFPKYSTKEQKNKITFKILKKDFKDIINKVNKINLE
tara:strand:- start:171 stop:395 length:225 start_codon:yes stop_codon:yes gene_type:complete